MTLDLDIKLEYLVTNRDNYISINKYIVFVTYQFYVTIYRDNFKCKYLTASRLVLNI